MLNIIIKLVVCTVVLFLADSLLETVFFPQAYQVIVTGVTLALAGHLLEWGILTRATFWITNLADFVVSTLIIYFFAYFFAGATVTWSGAMFTALILTAIEYFTHKWLINSGRARKEANWT